MIRTRTQIERVIGGIEANPGVVLFTLVNESLRGPLQDGCRRLQVPAIPVLDPIIGALGSFLGRESRGLPGQQHLMDRGGRVSRFQKKFSGFLKTEEKKQ